MQYVYRDLRVCCSTQQERGEHAGAILRYESGDAADWEFQHLSWKGAAAQAGRSEQHHPGGILRLHMN